MQVVAVARLVSSLRDGTGTAVFVSYRRDYLQGSVEKRRKIKKKKRGYGATKRKFGYKVHNGNRVRSY